MCVIEGYIITLPYNTPVTLTCLVCSPPLIDITEPGSTIIYRIRQGDMPRAEEKDNLDDNVSRHLDDEDEHEEQEDEEDLGFYGHIMKKQEVILTEEEKKNIEEEDLQNVHSVAFTPALVKEIISPHSFSILANKEPQVELAEPVLARAREVFRSAVDKAGDGHESKESEPDTLPRKQVVPMLVSMGYDHDQHVMTTIVERILSSSSSQREELDMDEWCLLLEEYHAPAYHYGQVLRKYCGRGEVQRVEELLARGCDVNTGDGEGLTPLHYAAELNQVCVIDALGGVHGGKGGGKGGLNVNAQDKYGWSPLHSAAHQGNTDAVQALLKLGADGTLTDKYGKTPLHYASAQVSEEHCVACSCLSRSHVFCYLPPDIFPSNIDACHLGQEQNL